MDPYRQQEVMKMYNILKKDGYKKVVMYIQELHLEIDRLHKIIESLTKEK